MADSKRKKKSARGEKRKRKQAAWEQAAWENRASLTVRKRWTSVVGRASRGSTKSAASWRVLAPIPPFLTSPRWAQARSQHLAPSKNENFRCKSTEALSPPKSSRRATLPTPACCRCSTPISCNTCNFCNRFSSSILYICVFMHILFNYLYDRWLFISNDTTVSCITYHHLRVTNNKTTIWRLRQDETRLYPW